MTGPLTVVVVAGGGPPHPDVIRDLPADALVIAADSGLIHARALGLPVDAVVGDLDSLDPEALAAAEAAGATVQRHDEAKDQTDLELAMDAAMSSHPDRIVVVGSDGGRLDHLLAGVLLLAAPRYGNAAIEARLGPARVTVVRGRVTLSGEPGDLVTLVPVGVAVGVRTEGLLYPLRDEDLHAGTTRGVSNELIAATATVTVADGVLLAVQPGEPGTHLARGLVPPVGPG